jgi:cytochrome b6-f complex subunit 4
MTQEERPIPAEPEATPIEPAATSEPALASEPVVASEPTVKHSSRTEGHDIVWTESCQREIDHEAEWGDQPTMRFFPDHFLSEAAAMLMLLSLYAVLAIFMPAGLETRANPNVTPVGIKPEWYFLFLYALLHYVPVVVGVIMPLVGFGLLGALPWLDRNPERAPRKRVIAIVASLLVLAGVIALSIIGLRD